MLTDLQEVVSDSLEAFDGGAGGEVSCPEGVRIGGIREEVIALGWPSYVRVMQGFQVARRSRVEHVDIGTVCLQSVGVPETRNWIRLVLPKTINAVLDKLILVLEPHFSVLIVKVFTHRKHYVVSAVR